MGGAGYPTPRPDDLAAIALFLGEEALRGRAPAGPFAAVKAIQTATILWAFWMLRRRRGWTRSIAVALTVVAEVAGTTALSGLLVGDARTIFLLFIVLTMGAAALLP